MIIIVIYIIIIIIVIIIFTLGVYDPEGFRNRKIKNVSSDT